MVEHVIVDVIDEALFLKGLERMEDITTTQCVQVVIGSIISIQSSVEIE